MPTGAFNICCPRDCVSRHNGGTAGAPLEPLRDDSALRPTLGLLWQIIRIGLFNQITLEHCLGLAQLLRDGRF